MDSVRELEHSVPPGVEVKRLAGRIVWLRHAEGDWLGPAEEALVLLRELAPGALVGLGAALARPA